ncbi:hypothetical protein [Streptomyces sp. GESEQ-4]|uniref:hypothetical protein n=1 Tax=Streptomyces sp. GESEQ-4 TaxID=2812655 RepID=UPI001B325148|nr:hypothetical protein [Streptomyces sp. GESEQ-4]
MSWYWKFQGLHDLLLERHPEWGHRVGVVDGKSILKITLVDETDSGVALAVVRAHHTQVWAVIDGMDVFHGNLLVWPLQGTSDETLVDALDACAVAAERREPLPSPWRWNESGSSELTELAELLAARRVTVEHVTAGNRYRALRNGVVGLEVDIAEPWEGQFLEARTDDMDMRVSLKPDLGWLVDVRYDQEGVWRRVDLGAWLEGQESSPEPGVPLGRVTLSQLADFVAHELRSIDAAEYWEPEIEYGDPRDENAVLAPVKLSPVMLAEAVVAQLRERGFGDVSEDRGDSVFRSDRFWIEWREADSSLSTSMLQRLNGIAAAEGRRLILLTTSDISRPAVTFADKARGYVFQVRRDTGELMPLNRRARETQLPRSQHT